MNGGVQQRQMSAPCSLNCHVPYRHMLKQGDYHTGLEEFCMYDISIPLVLSQNVWPEQVLAREACSLLWSLVDLNPRVLSAFIGCNVEDLSQPPALQPGLWSAILVSAVHPKQGHLDVSQVETSNYVCSSHPKTETSNQFPTRQKGSSVVSYALSAVQGRRSRNIDLLLLLSETARLIWPGHR